MNIDIFNGDADGICALIQLRLAYPAEAQLVTGVKRDIVLLSRVSVQPDGLRYLFEYEPCRTAKFTEKSDNDFLCRPSFLR